MTMLAPRQAEMEPWLWVNLGMVGRLGIDGDRD